MAYTGPASGTGWGAGEFSGFRAEAREPGARRRKFAGYLKAANELRQTYFNQDGTGPGGRDMEFDSGVEGPGAFPDAAVVRSGNEEMILFPSYGRRHVKSKPRPPPQTGEISEEEYWRREWERVQDDNAIVDVEVRGWVYTPQKGPATRKQRLMIGLARQLSGLPAPPTNRPDDSANASSASSRASSPPRASSKQDDEFIAREAENIVRKGEQEGRYASRGAFSEVPRQDRDGDSIYEEGSRGNSRNASPDRLRRNRLSQISLTSSVDGDMGGLAPPKKSDSLSQPGKMSSTELAVANRHLLNRLRPFMAVPLASSPVSVFFYSDTASRQHTVYTNPSGHFTCRAPLDFVPTHVRVLGGERLSATEEVTITSPKGVSLVSDIDDTVKHSAISAGAREIFRNAFIRELGDLTIEGVREWYNTLHDMGVQMHYVSNSPWQMYPILTSYFKLANLPRGSFHLKQYSGMLQGIFEPVAERKKSSLDKIMQDFPDRKFIFVGDSGEADLEVYTDVALDNPGRVLGVFIRDVTTTVKTGYFDPSNGNAGVGKQAYHHSSNRSGDSLGKSKRLSRPDDINDDDADLRAAITASLVDMEEETRQARRKINPDSPSPENIGTRDNSKARPELPPRRWDERRVTETPVVASPEEDLIDFTDEPVRVNKPWLEPPKPRRSSSPQARPSNGLESKPSPSPPPKPKALRSPSPSANARLSSSHEVSNKSPPPRPRKPSSAVVQPLPQQVQAWTSNPPPPQSAAQSQPQTHQPSPLSQVTQQSSVEGKRPPLPIRPKSSGRLFGSSKERPTMPPGTNSAWATAESAIGAPRPPASHADGPRALSTYSTTSLEDLRRSSTAGLKPAAPPPPPRRRPVPSLMTQATGAGARRASNQVSGGWEDYATAGGGSGGGGNLPGSPSEAGMSRKEFLWNQRWARAKRTLESQGVTLRSWRVGIDAADTCVKLVEQALREIERERKKGGNEKAR